MAPAHPWETDYTKIYHHSTYPAISPTRPELSASGKIVVVSGGGRGIGAAVVSAFAQAGAAHIFVIDRDAASLQTMSQKIETAYPSTNISAVHGDISREDDVARLFAAVKEAGGVTVDICVANAAHLNETVPLPQAQQDDWWRAFEVNVKGVFLQARHFLAAAAPNAAFINISAGAAHRAPPLPGFSAYASAKLAAVRVVETLQVENPALRFFNVQPGIIQTETLTKSGLQGWNPELPLDDLDLPGHFLVWLVSPEAAFLKGKFLWANWDVDELKARKEEILTGNKLVSGLLGWVV